MKRAIPVLTLGLVLGLAATAAAQKKPSSSSCGPDVYLNVQVIGTPSNPGGNALISDGNEFYNHGSAKGLVARFQVDNCTQDFTLLLGNSRRYLIARLSGGDVVSTFFNMDRVHSVPVTPEALFTDEAKQAWLSSPFCANGVQTTADGKIVKNADGTYQDNYAGCGVDDQGRGYVNRKGGVSLDGDARLAFNISSIDNPSECSSTTPGPVCATSFVRVYHPFATRWIVRADAASLASHTVWSQGAYVFQGYEAVPLEIIADRR